jgi:proliferating cell nuclear antigen
MSTESSNEDMSAGAAALASATTESESTSDPEPTPDPTPEPRDEPDPGTDPVPVDSQESDEGLSTNPDEASGSSAQIERPEDTATHFEAAIEAGVLQDAVANANRWADEGLAFVTAEGIEIVTVDMANVGLAQSTIYTDVFEKYDIRPGRMGLPLTRLADLLSMADVDDQVTLSLDGETQKLTIRFGAVDYTMALIDPACIRSQEDPDRQGEIEYENNLVVKGSAVRRGIDAATVIADFITFGTAADVGFTMRTDSAEESSSETIRAGEQEGVDISELTESSVTFALEHLGDIVTPLPHHGDVQVSLGDDLPIRLEFTTGQGVRTKFLIAPRIDTS